MARTFTSILVPTDFSEPSDTALEYARTLAAGFGASLHLLHVVEDPFLTGAIAPELYGLLPPDVRDTSIADAEAELAERFPAAARRRVRGTIGVVTGNAARSIVSYADAHGIDLIVMGTHGRTGVSHLIMGSVAERVVRTAHCPVLTTRPTPQPVHASARAFEAATVSAA